MAAPIYWVGDGQLLVAMKNGKDEKIKSGQEIKPEHLSDGKTPGIGLSPEFIAAHTKSGNISENPLAGKKVSGNKFLENKVVEQQRRIEELERIVASNLPKAGDLVAPPADSKNAAGKNAAAQEPAPENENPADADPGKTKKGFFG